MSILHLYAFHVLLLVLTTLLLVRPRHPLLQHKQHWCQQKELQQRPQDQPFLQNQYQPQQNEQQRRLSQTQERH